MQINPDNFFSKGGGYLSSDMLINNTFSTHTQNAVNSNGETLQFYIDKDINSRLTFDDGGQGTSLGHSSLEENFIRNVFEKVDAYIDLDFQESYNYYDTTFDIYSLSDYTGWTSNTAGNVNSQGSGVNSYWDIYWRDTSKTTPNLNNFDANTIVHEIGHALGLSHPNEDPGNPLWNTFDTVMSYNKGPSGWNTFFSDADLLALQKIWGVEDDGILRTDIVTTSTWSRSVRVNTELTGSTLEDVIQAKQVESDEYRSGPIGSIVNGTSGDDIIRGLGGWDQLNAGAGDDLVHGGNGRDIISGGAGSDELHGDLGWNTYSDQRDGFKDLIAIKSDQYCINPRNGSAGNSPNGEKADFIEGLDEMDEIKIIGASTADISVLDNVTVRGVTGIGIYAHGTLEAVFMGENLNSDQIWHMSTGEIASAWSYWGNNNAPELLP